MGLSISLAVQNPTQEGIQLGERGGLPETTEEPQITVSQSSGDAAIQKRYLEAKGFLNCLNC